MNVMNPFRLAVLTTLSLFILSACGGGGGSGAPQVTTEPVLQWSAPGGNATINADGSKPFAQFAPAIDASEMAGVSQGRELFVATWQPAPGARDLLDGLGPLFNAQACISCHASYSRVPALNEDGSTSAAMLFRIADTDGRVHPVYGGQLQPFSTAGDGKGEGEVRWQLAANGAINWVLTLFGSEPLGSYAISPRLSPQLNGTGLLDLVTDSQILQYADPNDSNGDGISGRPHWVVEEGQTRLGRFGWKAINASLRTQNAGALHQDMGLTTMVHQSESCTVSQTVCSTQPNGGQPEVGEAALLAISDFMTALGVPDRRIANRQAFDRGARLFNNIGCAACHRPTLTTGNSTRFPKLSQQTIYPYTDMLLHDMGDALADGVKEGDATGREWRTPPLWGLGLVEQQPGARFLHDGRARTLPEAISWHGGEAQAARNRYSVLTNSELADLLVFLRGI